VQQGGKQGTRWRCRFEAEVNDVSPWVTKVSSSDFTYSLWTKLGLNLGCSDLSISRARITSVYCRAHVGPTEMQQTLCWDVCTHITSHTHTHTHTQTERDRDRETDRQRETETERQTDRERQRDRDRETDRQRETERQRQRDRQTETERQRQRQRLT